MKSDLQLHPIRTDADYRAALKQAKAFFCLVFRYPESQGLGSLRRGISRSQFRRG